MNNNLKKTRASELDVKLGARIKKIREYRGLSQQSFATMLGVSIQQIQKYEKGINRISATKLQILAQKLDISIAHFLDFDEFGNFKHTDYAFCVLSNLDKVRNRKNQKILINMIHTLVDQFVTIEKLTEHKIAA